MTNKNNIIRERTEAWYSGSQQGQPSLPSSTGIMRFKDFYGIDKERTLSNDWQKDLALAKQGEIEDVTKDVLEVEPEEIGYDKEFLEDPFPEFDIDYPDGLNDFQQTISAKPARRDTRVDYGYNKIKKYKAYESVVNDAISQALRLYFKNMPEYVFNEFVDTPGGYFREEYKSLVSDREEEELDYIWDDYINLEWTNTVITVDLDDFDSYSKGKLTERKLGDLPDTSIPDDFERTQFQRKAQADTEPGTNEPVIVKLSGNGYELLEGWHRTMAILKLAGSNKAKINAWVGRL